MLDFRLRVFYTVAKLLNFTKAAASLHISQPAVTKHIKELEQSYKVTLFDRQPNALSLTDAGRLLYKHAVTIIEQYDLLDFDINALNNRIAGDLRIAASTTIAQYVIPPILASFSQRMPEVAIHLINDNSHRVQQLLMDKVVDIGFIEGKNSNHNLQYIPYLKDEIVLVCRLKNNDLKNDIIDIADLLKLLFVSREDDSGTHEIISEQLKNAGINPDKLKTNMHFSSTESIKSFLANSNYFAFISVQAIVHELGFNSLRIVDINNLEITRTFHIVLRHGQPNPIVTPFLKFIRAEAQ